MATINQYPLGKALACPYVDCDSFVIEKIDGVSECAYTFPVDSNKVVIRYICKKCNRSFAFKYTFNVD